MKRVKINELENDLVLQILQNGKEDLSDEEAWSLAQTHRVNIHLKLLQYK